MNKVLLVVTAIALLYSCKHEPTDGIDDLDRALTEALNSISPTGHYDYYVMPNSIDFEKIPQDPKNPLSWQKMELGKMLFFETGIGLEPKYNSGMQTYSCGTCHVPSAGYLPARRQGVADGGVGFGLGGEARERSPRYEDNERDVQGARPLSVLNVAYVSNTLWNGMFGGNGVNEGTEHLWDLDPLTEVNHLGYHGLESQNIEGLTVHRMLVNKDITDSLGYTAYFDQAFPEFPESERYSKETASLAISAYLRTLLTTKAPFQRWLKGRHDAMTDQEKRGALLFFGEAKCFFCHKSPALQSNEFHALGVKGIYQLNDPIATTIDDRRNLGRGGFTRNPDDYYKFQVPQLYNLKNARFYFHGASKESLREVVEYFNEGVPENPDVPQDKISPRLQPLNLTDQEVEDLTKFLEDGLYDPDLERYVPPIILSGLCYPNNDPMSRLQLGCD